MPRRKTIHVKDILDVCNGILQYSDSGARPGFRAGVICVLEHFLHETGNYRGFRYLTQWEVPAGERPGVHSRNGEILPYPYRFEDTDPTRVQYN